MLKIHLEEFFLMLLRDMDAQEQQLLSVMNVEEYPDPLINDIINYLRAHITENVTISELCSVYHYSRTFLCNRFVAVTGKTINHFLTELKIDAAKSIIRDEKTANIHISQIANVLNFSSPSYFSYVFKKATGMSPAEYAVSVRHYESNEEQ